MTWLDKIKDVSQKAGEAVKEEYKKQQAKTAQINDLRGKKLATLMVEYIGGYGEYGKSSGRLSFFQKRLEYQASLNKNNSFTLDNANIVDVAIEGRHDVNRRVTVTRLLAVGIFAFALKKKSEEKEAFITVVLADRQEVVFHVKSRSPLELKSKLAAAISQVRQGIISATSMAGGSVADELSKLGELKEQGLITGEEFEAQKQKLLS